MLTRLNLGCSGLRRGAGAGAAGAFGPSALTLGLPAAAFLALCVDGIARPGSSLAYPTMHHGPRDRNRVALTFDDGPDPEVTPRDPRRAREARHPRDLLLDRPIARRAPGAGAGHRRGWPRARQPLVAAFAPSELPRRRATRSGRSSAANAAVVAVTRRARPRRLYRAAAGHEESAVRARRVSQASDPDRLVAAQPRHAHLRTRADRATRAPEDPPGRHRADARRPRPARSASAGDGAGRAADPARACARRDCRASPCPSCCESRR